MTKVGMEGKIHDCVKMSLLYTKKGEIVVSCTMVIAFFSGYNENDERKECVL